MKNGPQTFDRIAAGYDKAMAPLERWFLSGWRQEALRYLPENSRILEIGAGTGLNFCFYPPVTSAAASEVSSGMLEFARTKLVSNEIKLIQANAESLPFTEDSFDAAFGTLVFCSIPDPQRAFAELRRVVKEGGRVVLLEHVRPNGLLGILFDLANYISVALIDDHFNRRTVSLARESGLRIVDVKRKLLGIVNLIICEVEKARPNQLLPPKSEVHGRSS